MVQSGLEGVVVAETRTSFVDGDNGVLIVGGLPIAEIAEAGSLEAVAAQLWGREEEEIRHALGRSRERAWPLVTRAEAALRCTDGVVALRAGLALLEDEGFDDIVGAAAVLTGAWARLRVGQPPIPPDPERPHAEDLLRMVRGEADPARTRALGTYLCTVAEHGMNASTFTARVVASTRADAVSAVVAALGALKGPLHGGAPGPVLDMLDAVETPDAAEAWIAAELEAGRRIMGMGHRVYRVRDPRAAVLERATQRLGEAGVSTDRLALARAVERAAEVALAQRSERVLRANVEFYTAVLLDAIGVHRALFTPLFACARTVGWLAHVEEQRREGRLIRPRAHYVGPSPRTQ